MSHAHAECSKAILAMLDSQPDGMMRLQLYRAVHFHGKTEPVFGACLNTLCEAGDVVMQPVRGAPTIYRSKRHAHVQKGAQLPPAPAEQKVIVIDRPTGKGSEEPRVVDAASVPRPCKSINRVAARRQQIREILAAATEPMTTRDIHDKTADIAIGLIRNDLDRMRAANEVQSRTVWLPLAAQWQSRWWPASKPWPDESEAPTAVPAARAPGEAAAPAGAADPEAMNKWKEIDDALEGAYIYAKKALQLHRQRKPA